MKTFTLQRAMRKHASIIAPGIVFFAAFLAYMSRAHPNAIFMDSLRFLTYVGESFDGKQSLWYTWNQGDHHGMFPQFVIYLNARFFGLNVFGATILGGVIATISAFALCRRAALSFEDEIYNYWKPLTLMMSVLIFSAMLSAANWELYTIDLSPSLFGKNLILIGFWIALDRYIESDYTSKSLRIALCLSVPPIILLFALGWSFPFTAVSILCLFWRDRNVTHKKCELVTVFVASLLVYVVVGYFLPKPELILPPVPPLPEAIMNSLQGFFMGLSTSLFGEETMLSFGFGSAIETTLGAILFTFSALCIWLSFKKRREGTVVPTALLLYVLFDAAAIALGRAKWNPWNATAARYYQDFSLILIGTAWSTVLLWPRLVDDRFQRAMVAGFLIATLSVFSVGYLTTNYQEWNKAPYRHQAFEKMRKIITLQGRVDDADARYMQQIPKYTDSAIDVMRKYQLGPFLRDETMSSLLLRSKAWSQPHK